jgi:hypothetical protein
MPARAPIKLILVSRRNNLYVANAVRKSADLRRNCTRPCAGGHHSFQEKQEKQPFSLNNTRHPNEIQLNLQVSSIT